MSGRRNACACGRKKDCQSKRCWPCHKALVTAVARENKVARFWSLVDFGPGCWEWKGQILVGKNGGYGIFAFGRKPIRAHQESWRLHFGPIPAGKCVLHTCDNRKCVRPSHLFLGTRTDNATDKATKGRAGRKLTPEQVVAIRYQRNELHLPLRRLADDFGVSVQTICTVARRKTWTLYEPAA